MADSVADSMINLRDALALGRSIASGAVTAEAAASAALNRVEARDGAIFAWKTVHPEQVLAEARARDAAQQSGQPYGPLHGVPVGVKDVIDTADLPTGYGSQIYEGAQTAADAACVALLREAGMVVLGKTVSTEFAMRTPGATRNPHNTGHTPGGSSSGSAAAVADGHAPLAIGTQTSGSVIRPASFCGVIGYKPSWGAVPRGGLKMLAENLDVIGAMANSPADARAFVQAMAGAAITPMPPLNAPPRFGIARTNAWSNIEHAGAAALETAAAACRDAGATVVDIELPPPFADALAAQDVIMTYEGRRMLAHERTMHWEQLSPALQDVMERGAACTADDYAAALKTRGGCRHALASAFANVDVLLTPAAPGEAPKGLDFTGSPDFNRIWTFAGAPCVTVPGLTGPAGLPIGAQLIGKLGGDDALIAAAEWLHTCLTP